MNLKQNEKLFGEFPAISTQEWENTILTDLKGADYQKKLVWKTEEGFDVQPYYRSEDLTELTYLNQLPNAYAFVRGQKTDNNQWDIVQYVEESDPQKANAFACDTLKRGANVVCFNASKVIDSGSMTQLLANINPEETAIRFKHVSSYPKLVELFINELKRRSINMEKVTGSIDFDPICYMLLHKSFYVSQDNDLNELIHVVKKIILELPNFKALTVNTDLLHNSGSTISQEMGYGLAWASEYMAYAIEKGISATNAANSIMFSMSVGSNYFMEIAKLRAFRMLWSIVAEQYKVDLSDFKIYIHSNGSIWNKSVYDPNVNMLRSTTEGMAAIIGGTNSLTLRAYDLAFKSEDEFSSRISRNVQLMLKHEAYFDKIVDPAAGSYYIETLTDKLAKQAWTLFQETEAKGGFIKLALDGEIKKEIEIVAQKRDSDIANRKITILGTNQYPNPTETMLDRIEDYNHCYNKYEGLNPYRGTMAFEELRMATEKFAKAKKHQPSVFMLTIGSLAMRKARASFSAGFFGCAGFEIIDNLGFETVEQGVEAALDAKSEIVVICSSDDEYAEYAPAITQAIKAKNSAVKVVVAGNPTEILELLKQAGVNDFIHARTNVLEKLTSYCKELGII
jgi:methylmalonyl-CoA mutase